MQVDTGFLMTSRATTLTAELTAKRPMLFNNLYDKFTKVVDDHLLAAQIIIDGNIFAGCIFAAFAIRFEGIPTGQTAHLMLIWLPILVVARLLVNWSLGVYRLMWRFFCLCDTMTVSSSLFIVTLALLLLRVSCRADLFAARWLRLPLGVIALEFLLSLSTCMAARAARRVLHERGLRARLGPGRKLKRVILYGAGRAGISLIRELADLPDLEVVGFVDDDPRKTGTVLSGIKVLGTGKMLETIVRTTRADQVVISIVTASAGELAQILATCKRVPIAAKIVPSMRELVTKNVQISHIRDIRVEDLLGRDVVGIGDFGAEVVKAYAGKRILVTGAGGSIGSELTRQLLLVHPKKISILDKDENSIYELEQELRFRNPEVPIEAVIADIKIPERVFAVFAESKPEVVFHAAAHKHVPLMELHPCEAILNNIMGTENVLNACQVAGTERLVFISTDKAVNPTNIMGATKRAGENIVRLHLNRGVMKAACVRFGNVMGSRGSVVPLFLKQIREGGPVTVTHPDVVRYFMTIPEAVQLVLCAGSLADAGEIFVLKMGTPQKIMDLARQTIVLCGMEPEKDIQIVFTGLRPGEKMNEELVGPNEMVLPTRLANVSVIESALFDEREFSDSVTRLIKAARSNDRLKVYEILETMGLGYTPTRLSVGCSEPQYANYPADAQRALARAASA